KQAASEPLTRECNAATNGLSFGAILPGLKAGELARAIAPRRPGESCKRHYSSSAQDDFPCKQASYSCQLCGRALGSWSRHAERALPHTLHVVRYAPCAQDICTSEQRRLRQQRAIGQPNLPIYHPHRYETKDQRRGPAVVPPRLPSER